MNAEKTEMLIEAMAKMLENGAKPKEWVCNEKTFCDIFLHETLEYRAKKVLFRGLPIIIDNELQDGVFVLR